MRKALGPGETQAARDFLAAHLKADTTGLAKIIGDMQAESFAAGTHAASIGADVLAGFGPVNDAVDWSAWTPGYADAARAVGNGGLSALLDQAGVAIQGITGTTLDQMGTQLAEGLASGANVETIADSLTAVADDPDRAYLIADTEAARSMQAATLDTYAQNGVDQLDYLVFEPCDECQDNADGSPYDIADFPEIPFHPRCKCASAPHYADPSDSTADDTAQEGGE